MKKEISEPDYKDGYPNEGAAYPLDSPRERRRAELEAGESYRNTLNQLFKD